ncbi:hypothetical protein Peur_019025 [Populus x canadensis]
MDHIVRAIVVGMATGASSTAPISRGVVTIVQWVRCMRGMGCMTYRGEEDVEIDPSRVLPHNPMKIKGDLTMEAKPVKILDRDVKVLRNKIVSLVRVLWRNSRIEEETWERESEMKQKFPHLFFDIGM